jgi:hypothetical protein
MLSLGIFIVTLYVIKQSVIVPSVEAPPAGIAFKF